MSVITIKTGIVTTGRGSKLVSRRIPHNQLNQRMHFIERNRWNQAWKTEVGWLLKAQKARMPAWPLKRPLVTIILQTCHPFDQDGSNSAIKPILDGMVECGCLEDDSLEKVDLKVQQEKVTKKINQGVKIIIEPTLPL